MTPLEFFSLEHGDRLQHPTYGHVEAHTPTQVLFTEVNTHEGIRKGIWLRVLTERGYKRLTGTTPLNPSDLRGDKSHFIEINPNRLAFIK
jgi:hypothetical protein